MALAIGAGGTFSSSRGVGVVVEGACNRKTTVSKDEAEVSTNSLVARVGGLPPGSSHRLNNGVDLINDGFDGD